MDLNIPSGRDREFDGAELADQIHTLACLEGKSAQAAILFHEAALAHGSKLALSPKLPQVVFDLSFGEEIASVHKTLRHLTLHHSDALVANPFFDRVIEILAKLNQAYEATQLFADIAKAHPVALRTHRGINNAVSCLSRKDAGPELVAIKDWIDSGHDPETFPTLERLEQIRIGRETGTIPTTGTRQPVGIAQLLDLRTQSFVSR